ncbi:glycosyl hydrolase family 28-related protein [Oceanicola sp. 502str15]|uniref:glycosyl hydrolase family 28-related protein n=1 Tax=Oceanicola sp. 502str15 TaxID=2696061 RepID=UPI002094C51A|nr:glycosyl hydrolase family 28-related protein [Oceanicola sp. 502str15]MCO6383545.1 right-handed parallel beta-helix repeat-containing protein [Oceanicola sp. 502str15]
MNKAITDGIVFMPPPFAGGLDVWSKEDGTPGSATYDGDPNAALVPSDADFGGCVELIKTTGTQKLRYMGETPVFPGCYLRVTARLKAVAGNLPAVRIAAWAGGAGSAHVTGLDETGPSVSLTSYGEVVEVSAIIGTANRTGVNMPWTPEVLYAHVGLDLTGPNGGSIRIDDLVVEDITSAFLRDMMDWVDVRDFGAVGDGLADDAAAFNAADDAAAGRAVLVPEGTYYLGSTLTIDNPIRFVGTVTMPDDKRLSLKKNFDLPTYIEAFGNEVVAFKKAIQSLFNFNDHDSLDMGGRKIDLTEPIDIKAAVDNQDSFLIRRVIRNGQFQASTSSAWDDTTVTSQASYDPGNSKTLTGVSNVANIEVGSLVTGAGVGREVYVKSRNIGAQTVTLSKSLYGAAGTQNFTFTRFKYMLDFSGMVNMDKFVFSDIEFQCSSKASAIMLPQDGLNFHIRDCFITSPKDRGITSIGGACQGMQLDRCQFLSKEGSEDVQDRTTIAVNINSNDAKIRDCRAVRFLHFLVLGGSNYIIQANHWFQGDSVNQGLRSAGIVFTSVNVSSTLNANYVDNSFIEWTNEHDATPDYNSGYSFGALSVQNNIFFSTNAASWFSFFVIKPFGAGHFIHGLTVTGNMFKTVNGAIDRVENVDESYAGFDYGRFRNIQFHSNTYNGVNQMTVSPVMLQFDQATAASTWTLNFGDYMPFGGRIRNVESVVAENSIDTSGGGKLWSMPYVRVERGATQQEVDLEWESACTGRVQVTGRVDNPN